MVRAAIIARTYVGTNDGQSKSQLRQVDKVTYLPQHLINRLKSPQAIA